MLKRWHWLCTVSLDTALESKASCEYIVSCEEYALQGCKVYATARRVESMATFQSPYVEKLALDVLSDEQVKDVVKVVIEKEGHIDILVNNAGVNCGGTFRRLHRRRRH